MRHLALFVAPLLCVAALGCSKSPQRVCDHLVDMAEKQFGDLDDAGAGMRDKAVQTCVQEKTAWKTSDGKTFDCFAECVLDVRTLAEAAECGPRCGVAPKRHAEEEPEPEGVPGLWTDPYADAKGAEGADGTEGTEVAAKEAPNGEAQGKANDASAYGGNGGNGANDGNEANDGRDANDANDANAGNVAQDVAKDVSNDAGKGPAKEVAKGVPKGDVNPPASATAKGEAGVTKADAKAAE